MSKYNVGGAAFPTNRDSLYLGMSLRDYFAAKAMQGAIACCPSEKILDIPGIADGAYRMADAMLKARE